MKKLIIILFIGIISMLHAKINVVVSVLPQQTFTKAIGGDKVNISVMVKPGNSPHSYEPKPSQMIDIQKADLYFAIGVEFEHSWIPKFSNQNKNMLIVDISKGIKKEKIVHHDEEELDPHIWTSPANVIVIVNNIYEHLVETDSQNKIYYKNNLNKFLDTIKRTDEQIKRNLKDIPKGSKFMVFHPAWGYFAKQYDLVQLSVEIDGKSPKPRALAKLMKQAKKYNVKAIFTQPEFSTKTAQIIAKELNIEVIKVSPIHPHWSENLIKFSEAIKGNK